MLQAGSDPFRSLLEGSIGDDTFFVSIPVTGSGVAVKTDVRPVGVDPGVPVQNLGQGGSGDGQPARGLGNDDGDIFPGEGFFRAGGAQRGPQQVTGRFGGGENVLRQHDAEVPFDADQQFDPAQAIQADVLVQRAIQRDRGFG